MECQKLPIALQCVIFIRKPMPAAYNAPRVGKVAEVKAFSVCLLVLAMASGSLAQNTPSQVEVWIYRQSVDSLGSAVPLYLDGRKLVNLGQGKFFGIQVPAGLHAFNWTNQPGARQVVVPIGADPQAYLEVTFNSSSPFISIKPLSSDKALSAMSGLRPIGQSAVFDSGVIVPVQAFQAAVKAPSTDSAINANPAPVAIPAPKKVAATSTASVPQIASSYAVNRRDNTPAEDVPRNLLSKAGKETIWVTASHDSNVVNRSSTDQTPGTAEDPCGISTTVGSVTTGNVNCSTTYNPPQQHKTLFRVDVMDRVQAEDGRIYTITCSAHWIGSSCATLIDGDRFKAEVEKMTMWITAQKGGSQGKDVRVKYKILDIR